MAQLLAANVTYAMVDGSRFSCPSDPRTEALFNVSFGDGTATYTNGGIPLTKAKLGCPATIQSLSVLGSNNYSVKWNRTADTLQLYAPDSHLHNFIMLGGVATGADFIFHSTGAIGKAAATNVTIAGSVAATGSGGVVGAAASTFAEVLTAAIVSATTVTLRVIGW